MDTREKLQSMYDAISAGATGEDLSQFFDPEAEQIEYPSLMRPAGHRRALAELLVGAEYGRELIREQRFDLHTVIEDGDNAAVQLTWQAVLAMAAAGLPAGTPLVSHVAAFYVLRDGRILRQSSYDCYEPLPVAARA